MVFKIKGQGLGIWEIAKHDEMMAKYETYRNTQIPGWMWKGVCEESTIIEADKEEE